MLRRLFITGTDTNIGKTVATRALLQAINRLGKSVVGYKPIATEYHDTLNGKRNRDAMILHDSSSVDVSYQDINPVMLESNYGQTTTEVQFSALSQGLEKLSHLADQVVVEGNGGWRYLLNNETFLSDWVKKEKLPVIMVVGIQSGCVNHALLTAEAIKNDGLEIIGWIANRINPGLSHYAQVMDRLLTHLPAPLLGEIPYLLRPEERELSHYLNEEQIEMLWGEALAAS
ncbi:ATP-dependent dethiobiotin synthetase BioD [Morganella morganii]|uniref:dethiobiotin synthase n=1 Tax=Morganella TaxID=581 RepID=UPI000D1EA45A|nr:MULTISPECIES: dethiobiotin synthase [Morganella]HAE76714.1 dethiobiotin synthase [Morganella sp. (in: enterobacteria)]EKU5844263.1 ATP-dependent dethiobiotin synthetase BioD [Morganella morganii]MBA5809777.1 ATP-dependent dethiobiotin synthetase BioD [Morganella morganii]NIH18868.1 ATP-dependent dethiobiotin synthetase BioD [Morganella morganii]QXO41130.1 ATP-dependent dethiobiotin synthetase BioD [Morganella morganii]